MIGFYIHHVGHGHLHQALSVAARLDDRVTALSSLPPHPAWPGDWVTLPRDDRAREPVDPAAGGRLHWAPLRDVGLQDRMASIAAWIAALRPRVLVVDLSVEVLTLARLMGVPAVTTTLPGIRDDPAHRLGYDLATAIVAPWPPGVTSLEDRLRPWHEKVHYVGAISRFDGRRVLGSVRSTQRRQVLAIRGSGTRSPGGSCDLRGAIDATRGWQWTVLGPGAWVDDPWPQLCRADVVVTHAGMGALADVAAARKPGVVLPEVRPHREQELTGEALASAGIAVVESRLPAPAKWPGLLETALEIGGCGWSRWSTGAGGRHAADVVRAVADRTAGS